MGDAGIKSAIHGSNVPNPDDAVRSFVAGAMGKAGKGLLEGTLQAGNYAVSDKLLYLVCVRGKCAADKGKGSRDYLFFFQAEDSIRDTSVTGVQTCALPILRAGTAAASSRASVTATAAMKVKSGARGAGTEGRRMRVA